MQGEEEAKDGEEWRETEIVKDRKWRRNVEKSEEVKREEKAKEVEEEERGKSLEEEGNRGRRKERWRNEEVEGNE